MSFQVKCPHCGQVMECMDEWSGKKVRCPACNQVIGLSFEDVPGASLAGELPTLPKQGAPSGTTPQPSPYGTPPSQASSDPEQRMLLVLSSFSSHLTGAILATIFCCMPIGIVAIVQASRANRFFHAKQYEKAYSTANSAATWEWLAIGLGTLFYFVSLACFILG